MDKLTLPRIGTVLAGAAPDAVQTRPLYFSDLGFVDTPVFNRHQLRAGHVIHGPAVVEQTDATTMVYPGHTASVDPYGNLLMRHSRR